MKKLVFILILFFAANVQAQPIPVLPYITQYIRGLLNDPNATEARDTLELGEAHDPNFASVNILGNHFNVATKKTPSGVSDTGTKGDLAWDENYIYGCIETNTWRRIAWATWAGVEGYMMIYEDSNTMVFEDGNTMVFD